MVSGILGVHALLYSKAPGKLRAFFRDKLGLPYVDAGGGWLIFALPPAELGIHPAHSSGRHQLYLMCRDIASTVEGLRRKGVVFARGVQDAGWGLVTAIKVPGGGELGLYEPRHPLAFRRVTAASARRSPRPSRAKNRPRARPSSNKG